MEAQAGRQGQAGEGSPGEWSSYWLYSLLLTSPHVAAPM